MTDVIGAVGAAEDKNVLLDCAEIAVKAALRTPIATIVAISVQTGEVVDTFPTHSKVQGVISPSAAADDSFRRR